MSEARVLALIPDLISLEPLETSEARVLVLIPDLISLEPLETSAGIPA
jgi:hypothetical protein